MAIIPAFNNNFFNNIPPATGTPLATPVRTPVATPVGTPLIITPVGTPLATGLLEQELIFRNSPEDEQASFLLPLAVTDEFFEEIFFTQERQQVRSLLGNLKERGIELSLRIHFFSRIIFTRLQLLPEEMESLKAEISSYSQPDQKIIYRLANRHSRISIVRIMNQLGWGVQEPRMWSHSPSIFAADMDALQMRNAVLFLFRKALLRGCLKKKSTFNYDPCQYRRKSHHDGTADVGRMLGSFFFNETAQKIQREEMAEQNVQKGMPRPIVIAPDKVIVIDDDAFPVTVQCQTDLSDRECQNITFPHSGQKISLFAKEMVPCKRSASLEEVSFLFNVVRKTEYWDLHSENVIITQDGLALIDTEMKNFRGVGSVCFGEGIDELQKPKYTARTLVFPKNPEPLEDMVKQWEMDWAQHKEQRLQERKMRLAAETAALKASGCFYGCTFMFTEEELFPPNADRQPHVDEQKN